MAAAKMVVAAAVAFALVCLNAIPSHAALQIGFYKGKCNGTDVEATIKSIVAARFNSDRSIAAALLRLHFHDCFVRGCDASILLDGSGTEKTAKPNLSVRGYDLIDQAKKQLESKCPGVVSCADIIAVATRDAVVLGGGSQYMYAVQTGRRDGNISLASEAVKNLPGDSFSASQAVAAFRAKGLGTTDAVLLLGGHTVGVTHCSFIMNRLYNYNRSGKTDPNMDPSFASMLKARCPQKSTVDNTVLLDHGSPNNVDNSYYKFIMAKKGVLQVDQNIALDKLTNGTVKSLADGTLNFATQFGGALVRMGAIQVLTGTHGQIRTSCRVVKK